MKALLVLVFSAVSASAQIIIAAGRAPGGAPVPATPAQFRAAVGRHLDAMLVAPTPLEGLAKWTASANLPEIDAAEIAVERQAAVTLAALVATPELSDLSKTPARWHRLARKMGRENLESALGLAKSVQDQSGRDFQLARALKVLRQQYVPEGEKPALVRIEDSLNEFFDNWVFEDSAPPPVDGGTQAERDQAAARRAIPLAKPK